MLSKPATFIAGIALVALIAYFMLSTIFALMLALPIAPGRFPRHLK